MSPNISIFLAILLWAWLKLAPQAVATLGISISDSRVLAVDGYADVVHTANGSPCVKTTHLQPDVGP